jgi:hypothetical protein
VRRLLALVFLLPAVAPAQEVVTLRTRGEVTQAVFVTNMGQRKAEAAAIVYNGGWGVLNLRMVNGQPKFAGGNFLVRTRGDFIRNGIWPFLVDVPSDQATGVTDEYRRSDKQVADTRAVIAEIRRRAPGLPIFILTTSRSTLSGAHLGRSLGPDEVAGVVLTSTMIVPGQHWESLASFDFKSIKVPLLFVQHHADICKATLYPNLVRAVQGYTLISVSGGKPAESDPCEPFSAHGYFGVERPTVDAISAWMLKRPFPTEVR